MTRALWLVAVRLEHVTHEPWWLLSDRPVETADAAGGVTAANCGDLRSSGDGLRYARMSVLPIAAPPGRMRVGVVVRDGEGATMRSELWAIARAAEVRQAIAQCRANPTTGAAIAPDFPATYATFTAHRAPGYWNGYLTWVVVQALAAERWPQLAYSVREAAILVRRFLDEPPEEPPPGGLRGLLRARPRPLTQSVPEVVAMLDVLTSLGGAAAEERLAHLCPESDPAWSEEGALYFSDAERDQVLQTLPALRRLLIEPPHGPRFHFWIVRRPGLNRPIRDVLRAPEQFVTDLGTIFGHARDTQSQVFVLWAP